MSETATTQNTDVTLYENPQVLARRASDVAGVCREIVLKTAVEIQGRRYVKAEGWLAIATAHGCIASSRDVERVDGGYRAIGEIKRIHDGVTLAVAEGFVGEDEPTWFGGEIETRNGRKILPKRADYAIRAMCQTRAISRVCRAAFAHVVVLMDAGLQTTPAEEMPSEGFNHEFDRAPIRQPQATPKVNAPQDWRDAVIHFGKNKGVTLSKLPPDSLKWYQETWQPKPYNGKISEADTRLRAALDASQVDQGEPGNKEVPPEGELTIQEKLELECSNHGINFDGFRTFIGPEGKNLLQDVDSLASFDDVPANICLTLEKTPKLMKELIIKFGLKPA